MFKATYKHVFFYKYAEVSLRMSITIYKQMHMCEHIIYVNKSLPFNEI